MKVKDVAEVCNGNLVIFRIVVEPGVDIELLDLFVGSVDDIPASISNERVVLLTNGLSLIHIYVI